MTPESLIGPAAAKALAERASRLADDMRTQRNDYVERHEQTATFLEELVELLTPKAKPLPEVVTMEEVGAAYFDYINDPLPDGPRSMGNALSAFVLRWLRARLNALPDDKYGQGIKVVPGYHGYFLVPSEVFKALTGREWTP